MERPLKPRVLGDVIPARRTEGAPAPAKRWNAFMALDARVNLTKEKIIRIPFVKWARYSIVTAAAAFLIFGSVSAPTIFMQASGDTTASSTTAAASSTSAQQAALESQLQQLEGQIDQYQSQIDSYKQQGSTLNGEITVLNDKIASVNLQIKATDLTLTQLDQSISQTQSQIVVTQADIQTKKASLASLLQGLYETDQVSLVQMFLQNPQLSDFWDDTQNLALLQDNMRVAVQQVTDLASQLQTQEQQFEASKADAASIQVYQQAQASEIASTKSQESQLLTETKGQESKYQTLLTQTQATAAQIRNRIFQLLGGGQLSFEQAYQYAQFASNATGVDPSLILAVLDRESALGQNVGQCSYTSSMSPSNIPIFLQITTQLNLDPATMMVSCANADGAYGGAMGPAQFEPSTWELYTKQISNITGDNPPSPWSDSDAFVATALYLKGALTGCQASYTSLISQERCTAAKYYAGSDWQNYLWTYGEAVVEQAQSFAQDIQTITNTS